MFKKLQALLSNKIAISVLHGVEGFAVTASVASFNNLTATGTFAVPSQAQLIAAVGGGVILALRQQLLPLQSSK